PWDASAHDAISALAALTRLSPAPRTQVRLRADVAAQMIGADRDRFAEALREAAEVGVLSSGPEMTAWYGAPIRSDTQAARGGELGLTEPTSLHQLQERLALLDRVRVLLGTFQPAVFSAPLADLVAATADKRWREERGVTMGFGMRRRLRRDAVALQRPAALSPDPHRDLAEARRVADEWQRSAHSEESGTGTGAGAAPLSRPSLPKDLDALHRIAARSEKVLDELAVLLDGTA